MVIVKMKEYSTLSTTGNSGMLFFNIITYLYKFCEVFKKGFIVHSELIVISVSYSVVINLWTSAGWNTCKKKALLFLVKEPCTSTYNRHKQL